LCLVAGGIGAGFGIIFGRDALTWPVLLLLVGWVALLVVFAVHSDRLDAIFAARKKARQVPDVEAALDERRVSLAKVLRVRAADVSDGREPGDDIRLLVASSLRPAYTTTIYVPGPRKVRRGAVVVVCQLDQTRPEVALLDPPPPGWKKVAAQDTEVRDMRSAHEWKVHEPEPEPAPPAAIAVLAGRVATTVSAAARQVVARGRARRQARSGVGEPSVLPAPPAERRPRPEFTHPPNPPAPEPFRPTRDGRHRHSARVPHARLPRAGKRR